MCVPLVSRGATQVLRTLLDLQLLPDLPADPLPLLVQELLNARVGEVGVLVQTELLQNRQPAWVTLQEKEQKGRAGKTRENRGQRKRWLKHVIVNTIKTKEESLMSINPELILFNLLMCGAESEEERRERDGQPDKAVMGGKAER